MKAKTPCFKASSEERGIIDQIVNRTMLMAAQFSVGYDRLTCEMDLLAANNSNPLDLKRLLTAEDFDFAHDVFGIRKHINRETGELEDLFLPRFSKP